MRFRRGYFALISVSALALSTYACSKDKKGGSGTSAAVTSTGAGTTSGTFGGTTGGVGTTGGTTGATSVGGATAVTSTGSTSLGGATSMGGATSTGDSTTGDPGGAGGEGGEGPGCDEPPGEAIYTFSDAGIPSGWVTRAEDANVGGLADAFLMRNGSEGNSCAGSLALTVPFTVYGAAEAAEAQANFSADWSAYTTLHAWVKVAQPAGGSIDYLKAIQLFVQSNGYVEYDATWVDAPEFADFGWHEITVNMVAEGTVLASIDQVGVQVIAHASQEDAGGSTASAAPETTVVYIDDIYVD